MSKVLRDGLDVDLAFKTSFKQDKSVFLNQKLPQKSFFEGFLCVFAKCVYRLLKPFLRRVMPRVRSYFMDEASSIISRKITQEISHQTSLILPRLDKLEEISGVMSSRVSVNCGEDEVLVKTQVGYMLCSSKDHALLSCLLDKSMEQAFLFKNF